MKKIGIAILVLFVVSCGFISRAVQPTSVSATQTPTTTPYVLPKYTPRPVMPTATPIVVSPTPTAMPGTYVVQPGDTLAAIANKFGVPVEYLTSVNNIHDPNFIRVGQVLTIPKWPPDPPRADTNGKEIIVELSTQRTCAADKGQVIKCVPAATGLPGLETPTGHYTIYLKVEYLDMKGPGYNLKDVPWDMCFLPKGLGYCIHGAPWNHNLGHPGSHGCVNLSVDDAKWFYFWADDTTTVWVKN